MTLRYNQDREGSFKCFAIKTKLNSFMFAFKEIFKR